MDRWQSHGLGFSCWNRVCSHVFECVRLRQPILYGIHHTHVPAEARVPPASSARTP